MLERLLTQARTSSVITNSRALAPLQPCRPIFPLSRRQAQRRTLPVALNDSQQTQDVSRGISRAIIFDPLTNTCLPIS
jgi:hypothetical protein